MKKRYFFFAVLAIFGLVAFTACKKDEPKKPPVVETEKFSITFDTQGGGTIQSQTVEKGKNVVKPADPVREGYIFKGWYKEATCTNEWNFATDTVTKAITLYAKWEKKANPAPTTYKVSFDSQEGSSVAQITVEENGKIEKPTDPTREDYTFKGWYKEDACTNEWNFATDIVTKDITLYAKWEKDIITYQVSFDSQKGSSVAEITVEENGKVEKPADPTREGYTFKGWYKETDCTNEWDFSTDIVVEDITLYAKWSRVGVADGKIFMNGVEHSTIKEAFAAIPTNSNDTYTITLGKGTYNENGLMYKGSATIQILGSTDAKYGSEVIIKGHGSKMPGETGCDSKNRCLISIQGSASIILENLTLESDWYRSDHAGDVQAEVLGTDTTGNTAAYNCGFKSHQDTLRTVGKAWFYGCYIEGDVDFIWMEAGGKVALYENCEIVSLWDEAAKTHNTYITAPKMAETLKLGKGLVIYNSTVKESADAKAKGQKTYLARTPWSSGCYNQVAYINTKCEDIELTDGPWYKTQIATPFAPTMVGWKMDKATADSMGLTNQSQKDYILDANTVAKEFNGRNAIINRIFDTGKLRYVTDTTTNWDINALITAMGWNVTKDTSSDKLDGDTMGTPTIYNFKVAEVAGVVCDGFTFQDNNGNTHYVAQAGGTIQIPVNGKCYIEVYGYYAGTAEATTDTQDGKMIMFFNNASTGSEVENDYIVYDENARSFVLTAKDTTYITKIVVIPDSGIVDNKVESITIKNLKPKQIVGVPQNLTVEIGPKGVNNTSVLWTSSDESIAIVDQYTGKVTFLAEGNVTITATACDGSNVYASVECNPTIPDWTAIEWYTTTTTIATETGAAGIDMFDVNNSANKKLSKSYTFKNLAGTTITTNYGLKLNSSGKLSFATLKYAEVTLIVAPQQNQLVNPPSITNADGSKAILLSQRVDEVTGVQYFTYALTATGMWDIERLDVTMENNPILYAKVEYKSAEITESVGVTFKGSHYNTAKTGIETIITPGSIIDASNSSIQYYKFTLTNCASNGSAENWLKFNTGAKIEFKVDRATTLLVGYYSKIQTVKLNGVVVEGNKTIVANGAGEIVLYEITDAGVVTIEATSSDYLGFVGVLFKTLEQKKEEACSKLDKEYPANKYTQNANYETTLEAQKAAILAAEDEATLALAIAAAKTALDALEKDAVVEYPQTLNYVFANLATKPADGEAVESTEEITFTNCVAHNGQYIALKNDNEVKIKVAAGSTLTVTMPYSSGVRLNGEDYTLVENKLVYTATENTEVIITGAAGGAYIETIVITKAPKYAETLNYVFANLATKPADGEAVESTEEITFTNCVAHNGQYIALKNDNEVKIKVAAGSTLTVTMPYSSGVRLNGEDYTLVENKLVYTATENTEVIITGAAGGAYIETIVITKAPKYAETLNYVFANLATKPADGEAVESTEEITFTNCVAHNGQYIALKNDNEVKIKVAAGSTLTVTMPYSSGVRLNGEDYTLVENKLVYTATENTEVIITGAAGGAYIETIVIIVE